MVAPAYPGTDLLIPRRPGAALRRGTPLACGDRCYHCRATKDLVGPPKSGERMTKIERNVAQALGVATFAGAAALLGYALWWRKNPSACPYTLRFFVGLPHPFITRARLREILAPHPGERVLEVGPGTGYYALRVARWLEPGGTLEILDLQQEMLDHVTGRARLRAPDRRPSRVLRPLPGFVVDPTSRAPSRMAPSGRLRGGLPSTVSAPTPHAVAGLTGGRERAARLSAREGR